MKTSTLLRGVSQWLNPVTLIFLLVLLLMAGAASAQGEFITTWKTDNPGTSDDNQITIPTTGTGYNYNVSWEEVGNEAGNNGSEPAGQTGNYTITFASAGTYRISISGDFPRIFFSGTGDRQKILTIEQWGDISWTTMSRAFQGCSELTYNATDAPDLTGVSGMDFMFFSATSFDGDLNTWDVSSVVNMASMFNGAIAFDGNITSWEVGNITDMSGMFRFSAFNRDISGWDVSNVTDMSAMFDINTVFNHDISGWNVSKVENMSAMFSRASAFNRDIGNWEVGNVTDMEDMFAEATAFSFDLNAWDVSKVTDMKAMFFGANAFNHDLNSWDVSSVTRMFNMFSRNTAFNGAIGSWDVSSVQNFNSMFGLASSFDQDLSGWNISSATDMGSMFFNGNLSKANYDKILEGWSQLTLQNDVDFGANGITYCVGAAARQSIIDKYGWTFTDGGENCLPFITTWKTDNPGTSENNQITIPAFAGNSPIFDIDWGDGSTDLSASGPMTHTYAAPGTYTVSISGKFVGFNFNDAGDKDKLLTVEQWGDINTWRIISFRGCSNFQIVAEDAPNLSAATTLSSSFEDCPNFDSDIGHWNTSNIQTMQDMFKGATSFNQDINSWDVSKVSNMREMFRGASSFNQDLNDWDVSKVTNMFWMFTFASDFNGQVGNWDVSMVDDMQNMFRGTSFNQDISQWNFGGSPTILGMFGFSPFNQDISSWDVSEITGFNKMFADTPFNQDISSWDVSSAISFDGMFENATAFNQDISGWTFPVATNLGQMFDGASSFNQDLSDWDVSNITAMFNVFDNSGLSKANYDNTLQAWSQQALQSDLEFGAAGIEYCGGATARQFIIDNFNWTFVDGGENCIINIPDANFKAALLANASINTTIDGDITIQEAEAFSGKILVNSADGIVAELTGIEHFSNLEELQMISHEISEFDATNHPKLRNITLPGNNLSEIDISTNPNLTFVNLDNNDIASINVDNNVNIRDLKLNNNLLTQIDVTKLTLLTELTLGDNDLSEIDVTQNPDLVILDGYRNDLSAIDISQNTALKYLNFFGSGLTSIDVSDQPDLLKLSIGDNQITTLDLSVNVKLEDLRVNNTQLTTLDLSVNDKLEVLLAQNNSLNSLNLANGNNSAITSINITDNSSLTCITVDDIAYAEANFTNIDDVANFSLDCSNVATDITDFSLTEQVAPALIDATAHTVLLEVPVDTDLSSLTPTITISGGATIDPETAVAQDFASVVAYTVTAQNPSVSQEWLVTIREENNAPTAIELDNNTITEGNTIGAIVGGFATTDLNVEDTHTYSLVAGEGDTDNAVFDISGSNLVANAVFNFDTQSSYSIRIRSDDGEGGSFEEQFTISILDFTKSNQTITFSAIADKTYGDDRFDLAATTTSGLAVSYTITRGDDLVSLSGNRLTIEGAGEITVRADQAGNATFNPASSVQRSFTIDPAAITVTAENKQMTYGGELPALTATYTGFVDNEDATDLTTAPTIITTATATSNVGDFAITASNAEADNYTFTYVPGTLSIGKAPLTVTADDQMMLYGADVPSLTVAYDGFVNGDNEDDLSTLPVASTTGSNTSAVGEYLIAVAEAVSVNYEITYASGKLTITSAMLTITADDQSMVYGSEVPQLTYTIDGFIGGDDASILTTAPTVNTTATSQSSVGSYGIAVSAAVAPNYEVEYVDGNLEIGKATLLAQADAQSITFGDELPELTYSLSGFVNGDDASSIDQLPSATSSINRESNAGTYTITISGGSDDNYDFSYENAELVVAKAMAQIIVGELEFTADGFPKLPEITTDPAGLEVEVSINEGKDAPTEPGVYEVVITIIDPNFEGRVSGTLIINELVSGIEKRDLPSVFPNPTRDLFTVGQEATKIDRLVLFDLDGRRRKEVEYTNQINVSDQRAGVYLLWIHETDGTATYQKVIKRD
ncbi:MAG: BspA family leucine-rich repeat surface protein [Cyclobacteriaceae bacterium]